MRKPISFEGVNKVGLLSATLLWQQSQMARLLTLHDVAQETRRPCSVLWYNENLWKHWYGRKKWYRKSFSEVMTAFCCTFPCTFQDDGDKNNAAELKARRNFLAHCVLSLYSREPNDNEHPILVYVPAAKNRCPEVVVLNPETAQEWDSRLRQLQCVIARAAVSVRILPRDLY